MSALERRGKKWRVRYRDADGNRKSATFFDKESAVKFDRQKNDEAQFTEHGLQAPIANLLLVDYSAHWLRKRQKQVKHSTFVQDEARLRNYWIPKFGQTLLKSMTSAAIKEFLDHIQFELGHSPADRNRHRALLHKLFQDALFEERVLANPVSRVALVSERKKNRLIILDEPQQEAYLAAAFNEGASYGALATILLWGGVRVSEAIALQWSDIDFKFGLIKVSKIIEKSTSCLVLRTKGFGYGGIHEFPLTDKLRAVLDCHKSSSRYTRLNDFVCTNASGDFIPYDTYKDVHKRIIDRAALPKVTIHSLRHAFASNAARAGIPKAIIQKWLGHSIILTTEIYTHAEIDDLVSAVDKTGFGSMSQVTKLGGKRK